MSPQFLVGEVVTPASPGQATIGPLVSEAGTQPGGGAGGRHVRLPREQQLLEHPQLCLSCFLLHLSSS